MYDSVYPYIAAIEEEHWWYRHCRRLVRGFLFDAVDSPLKQGLDVGCGTGGNMPFLNRHVERMVGLDYSSLALGFAKEKNPGTQFVEGDANRLDAYFPGRQFDFISFFGVLYHQWIADAASVLRQAAELTAPGGYLVVTDAAFPILMRKHDELVMGKRRFKKEQFAGMLADAGYQCLTATYFNAVSFLPALVNAVLPRFFNSGEEGETLTELQTPNSRINKAMYSLMGLEYQATRLLKSLPFGVSILCIARRNP